jgi:hypothetical protein
MKPVELTVVDTNTATWELFPVGDEADPAAPTV